MTEAEVVTFPTELSDDDAVLNEVMPLARQMSALVDGTDMRVLMTALATLTSAVLAQATGGDREAALRFADEHLEGIKAMIAVDCDSIALTGAPVL